MNGIPHKTTHAFISYCHADIAERDSVIHRLSQANISIWFDNAIEAGSKWRPQIDTALNEAFCIVVVVTPNSMKSLYVTYEWSWAIGSSKPVFPFLVTGTYDDIHERLLDEHVVDCRNGIPDSLINTIQSKQTIPPDIRYINDKISEIFIPTYIQMYVAFWVYSQIDKANEHELSFFYSLISVLGTTTQKIMRELPELMVDKSHAFTSKQRENCRVILEETKELLDSISVVTLIGHNAGFSRPYPFRTSFEQWFTTYYKESWLPTTKVLELPIQVEFLIAYTDSSERASLVSAIRLEKPDESLEFVSHQYLLMAYDNKELTEIVWQFINQRKDTS